MKCLSVCQPWAWAIVHGDKRIENRTWFTSYRGPLLIHAGLSREYMTEESLAEIPGLPAASLLDFGAIIGRVVLFDICKVEHVRGHRYAEGPFCWRVREAQALPSPIPWRGQQGLFEVPWPIPRDTGQLFGGGQ